MSDCYIYELAHWARIPKKQFQMAAKVDPTTCDHFFVFGEKKETLSCSGTHFTHCKYCGMNLHAYAVENVEKLHYAGRLNGVSKQEKDRLLHVHVWDPVEGKPNTYQCCSDVTDWQASRPGWTMRIPCGIEIVKAD